MTAQCHEHGGVWWARCLECRQVRRALSSVQSGTVHAAPLGPDQRRRRLQELEAAGVPYRRRV